MTTPLVTVIVPNYNYGSALGHCLTSIQAQTYPALELLMVDDCSTDNSVAVAQALGVRVISTGTNSGVATTRNLGAQHAAGEILVFVDSDVEIRPDAVANAVAALQQDPGVGAVCGNYDPEPLIRRGPVQEYRSLQQTYWLVADEGEISTLYTAILAIPRHVFTEIGPFNPRLRQTEDSDYGRRLSSRYRVLLTPKVRGRHDHDATVGVIVRKVFHRTRLHVPYVAMREDGSRQPRGKAGSARLAGTVLATLAVLTLVVPFVLGAVWWALPAVLLAAFIASEPGMYRYVARHRGVLFLPFFTLMYLLVNLVIMAGLVSGVLQWLMSARFRSTYREAVA
ncbi:glycosyltransferase family 2 protein [Actinoplanes sp. TFC3]|uniref:glycosyltransferase family 2 protein n=1 Tax=Actinoplanes sp. TFC3 TaxID=1710355 RepID=UPI00082F90EE|nr:glycosyltransferase family 2 protein [Actinoplanes sp. TFC3]